MTDECASCKKDRPIATRGLCDACRARFRRAGTIDEWGCVRDDRAAAYAALRDDKVSRAAAALRVGVSERTAWRYASQLARRTAA